VDYFVLAWNNVSHPIVKLQNGAEHADCYNDLSFLRSALCADFNVRFIESKVVGIGIRVISEAIAADYIFYAYYLGAKHNLSLVQISVYLKDNPNTTSGESHTVLRPTQLPSEANTNTTAPVRNQALRSGLLFLVWKGLNPGLLCV